MVTIGERPDHKRWRNW